MTWFAARVAGAQVAVPKPCVTVLPQSSRSKEPSEQFQVKWIRFTVENAARQREELIP
jgi:hypothetical protein